MCNVAYKMQFEWFEIGIFFKRLSFPTQAKTNFPFILGQVLNYWASFSLFWAGFPSQHQLGLSNYYYFFVEN